MQNSEKNLNNSKFALFLILPSSAIFLYNNIMKHIVWSLYIWQLKGGDLWKVSCRLCSCMLHPTLCKNFHFWAEWNVWYLTQRYHPFFCLNNAAVPLSDRLHSWEVCVCVCVCVSVGLFHNSHFDLSQQEKKKKEKSTNVSHCINDCTITMSEHARKVAGNEWCCHQSFY